MNDKAFDNCDGCQAHMMIAGGYHYNAEGKIHMKCSRASNHTRMPLEQEAYESGKKDYIRGVPLACPPGQYMSFEKEHWVQGWKEARKENET